jgi:adenylate kinase
LYEATVADKGLTLHLIVMGPQGSGKGTQAALLAPALRLHHLSTGELFRAAIALGSPLGRAIQAVYDRGDLITDDLTVELVEERLDAIVAGDARSGSGLIPTDAPAAVGALFDGFPRTGPQAQALDELLTGRGDQIDGVIEITAPEEQLVERLVARGRSDDSLEGIRRRLEQYHAETAPLLEIYRARGLVVSVDGARPVETVHRDLVGRLRQHLAGTDRGQVAWR